MPEPKDRTSEPLEFVGEEGVTEEELEELPDDCILGAPEEVSGAHVYAIRTGARVRANAVVEIEGPPSQPSNPARTLLLVRNTAPQRVRGLTARIKQGSGPIEVTDDKKGRIHAISDISTQELISHAKSSGNKRLLKFFEEECEAMLRPETLRARFTHPEVGDIIEEKLIAAIERIASLTDGIFSEIIKEMALSASIDSRKGLEMTMFADNVLGEHGVVEATPKNIIETFIPSLEIIDPETDAILKHIKRTADLEPARTAIAVGIRTKGMPIDDRVDNVNRTIRETVNGDTPPYLVRPSLAMALQEAISRSKSEKGISGPSATVTTATGPLKHPIIVFSMPGEGVFLRESNEPHQCLNPLPNRQGGINLQPTTLYLVQDLKAA